MLPNKIDYDVGIIITFDDIARRAQTKAIHNHKVNTRRMLHIEEARRSHKSTGQMHSMRRSVEQRKEEAVLHAQHSKPANSMLIGDKVKSKEA